FVYTSREGARRWSWGSPEARSSTTSGPRFVSAMSVARWRRKRAIDSAPDAARHGRRRPTTNQRGGDRFRRGSVRRRRHLEVLSPRKTGGTAIAADNQLALAA